MARVAFRAQNLPPGSYRVHPIAPPPFEPIADHVVQLSDGDCGASLAVLTDQLARISGRVLDEEGRPMARVTVAALPSGADPNFDLLVGETDPAGRFTIRELAPGDYSLAVRRKDQGATRGSWPYPEMRTDRTLHVGASARVVAPDFRLTGRFAPATLEVQVVWPNGEPAGGSYVTAAVKERGWLGDFNPTDAGGRFSLPVFKDHDYTVYADFVGESPKRRVHAKPFELRIAKEREAVRLVLTEDGATQFPAN